jgi:hypothetical protein
MHKKLVLGGSKKKIFEIKTSSRGYTIKQATKGGAAKTATVGCASAAAAEKEAKEIIKVRIAEGYTPVEKADAHEGPAPKAEAKAEKKDAK